MVTAQDIKRRTEGQVKRDYYLIRVIIKQFYSGTLFMKTFLKYLPPESEDIEYYFLTRKSLVSF